jgi:hypothetical protein
MTDRELLEYAAKAAGIEILAWTYSDYAVVSDKGDTWTPLTDDGDALRLAVKLNLLTKFTFLKFMAEENDNPAQDYYAATRRAIVRAAAEIGRAMP